LSDNRPVTLDRPALSSIYAAGGVAVLCALFAALCLARFGSPGTIYDVLFDERLASEWALAWKSGVPLSDWKMGFGFCPLYHGTLTAYLMFPFFALFEKSWIFLRLWPILLGVLTLILIYHFVRSLFDRRVAFLTLGFLILHPPFVMAVRAGNFQVSYMLLFSVGASYALWSWWKTERLGYFALAVFLMSLGMATRLFFGWFIMAVFLSAIPLWGFLRRRRCLSTGRAAARTVAIGFLSTVPVLIPMLITELYFFKSHLYLSGTMRKAPALLNGFKMFENMLSGWFYFWWYFRTTHFKDFFELDRVYPWAVLLAAGYLIWRWVRNKQDVFLRKAGWIVTLFGGIFLAASTSPRDIEFSPHHFIIYPFPQILLAAAVGEAFSRYRLVRPWKYALGAAVAALLLLQGVSLGGFYGRLLTTGAVERSTDASKALSSFLNSYHKNNPLSFVACSWGIAFNLYFLCPDIKFVYRDDHIYHLDDPQRIDSDSLFVYWHIPPVSDTQRVFEIVVDRIQKNGSWKLIHTVCEETGTPIFTVYKPDRTRSGGALSISPGDSRRKITREKGKEHAA